MRWGVTAIPNTDQLCEYRNQALIHLSAAMPLRGVTRTWW